MITTERIIEAALKSAVVRPRESFVHAGGRGMHIRKPDERVLILPDGRKLRVSSDEQGGTTQFEEDDALHAVARLKPVTIRLNLRGAKNP